MLHAAPGFQLLATVTTAPGGGGGAAYAASNMVKEVLGGLWAYVHLHPPAPSEQLQLLATLHAQLAPLLPTALAALALVQLAAGHMAPGGAGMPEFEEGAAAGGFAEQQEAERQVGLARAALAAAGVRPGELALALPRHFSLRDSLKWCTRMRALHGPLVQRTVRQQQAGSVMDVAAMDLQLRAAAFTECADIFGSMVAKPGPRRQLLAALAALWALPGQQHVEQYEALAKPAVQLGQADLQVGRCWVVMVKVLPHGLPGSSVLEEFEL